MYSMSIQTAEADLGGVRALELARKLGVLRSDHLSTRWSTTLSPKVNLPHAIHFRGKCGAILVTFRSKKRKNETLVLHRVDTGKRKVALQLSRKGHLAENASREPFTGSGGPTGGHIIHSGTSAGTTNPHVKTKSTIFRHLIYLDRPPKNKWLPRGLKTIDSVLK